MINDQLKNKKELELFLSKYIPKMTNRFFGLEGLKKMKYFLQLLGSPQNKLKVIHLAGTSGKGSTAFLTSVLLKASGFKTGLHLSPHLLDIRERCQINNKLLSDEEFVCCFNEILPVIEKMQNSRYGKLTYFEIIVGLAFYIFEKKKVDYAIIETGLGGTYDGTNVVDDNKIVILTKIGRDHIEILGESIREIASNKAGIIQNENIVISIKQKIEAKKVIDQVCKKKQATLYYLNKWNDVSLNLNGDYQKENYALASKAVSLLSKRDNFKINKNKVKQALDSITFKGRFDIIKFRNKTLILDGAHNPQKMEAFISSLVKKYPKKKFNFLVAFKQKKDFQKMLKLIMPIAKCITVTNIYTEGKDKIFHAKNKEKIINFIIKNNFQNYQFIDKAQNAFQQCLLKEDENLLVVTGSFYLLTEIYQLIDK